MTVRFFQNYDLDNNGQKSAFFKTSYFRAKSTFFKVWILNSINFFILYLRKTFLMMKNDASFGRMRFLGVKLGCRLSKRSSSIWHLTANKMFTNKTGCSTSLQIKKIFKKVQKSFEIITWVKYWTLTKITSFGKSKIFAQNLTQQHFAKQEIMKIFATHLPNMQL